MAADAPRPPSRVLPLLLVLVLSVSAALAGGVAASLMLRDRAAFPSPPQPILASKGCEAPVPLRPPSDPAAALDAALGRPPAAAPMQLASRSPLAGLLAPAAPDMAPVQRVPQPTSPAPSAAPAPQPAPQAAATPPAIAAPPILAGYALDLGYFLIPDHAVAFAAQVQDRGVPVQLLALPDASGRVWTHVRTPPFAGSAQALDGAERLERALGIAARLVPPPPSQQQAGAARP